MTHADNTPLAVHHARRAAELIEDVEFLLSTGASVHEVADRTGRSLSALAQLLYRRGRPDLGRTFAATYQRERAAR